MLTVDAPVSPYVCPRVDCTHCAPRQHATGWASVSPQRSDYIITLPSWLGGVSSVLSL